jgi:hypothetical protein
MVSGHSTGVQGRSFVGAVVTALEQKSPHCSLLIASEPAHGVGRKAIVFGEMCADPKMPTPLQADFVERTHALARERDEH